MELNLSKLLCHPMYFVLPIIAVIIATSIGSAKELNPIMVYRLVDFPLMRIMILLCIG